MNQHLKTIAFGLLAVWRQPRKLSPPRSIGPAATPYGTGANWSTGSVPNNGDEAFIRMAYR